MDRIEEAKIFLQSTRNMTSLAEARMDKIEQLRSLIERCTASYGDEAVKHSRKPDRMGEIVAKLVDMENETNEWFAGMLERENTIAEVIDAIPDSGQQAAVRMHFVNGLSVQKTATELGVHKTTVIRHLQEGLSAVADILEQRGLIAA